MNNFKRFLLICGLLWALILAIQCAPHYKHHKKRHSSHAVNATTMQNDYKKPKQLITRRYTSIFNDPLCYSPGLLESLTKKKIVLDYLKRRCQHIIELQKGPTVAHLRSRRKSARGQKRKDEENFPIRSESKREYKKITRLLEKSKCQSLKQMVELVPKNAMKERYLPCMVPVKRCAGCCLSELEQCVATKTRMKKFKVSVLRESKRNNIDTSIRSKYVEEHLKCECKCKIQASDCGPGQIYEEKNCMCKCPSGSHTACPQSQIWNESECRCICRNVKECTTGMIFKHDTCSCELERPYLEGLFSDDLS